MCRIVSKNEREHKIVFSYLLLVGEVKKRKKLSFMEKSWTCSGETGYLIPTIFISY